MFRSVVNPEVMELGLRLLSAMGWQGVAAVEFLVDQRDGIPKLMEVNPRFWGTLSLSILAGVDFPMLLHRMAMEGDIDPLNEYRADMVCQWLLPGDMLHFITSPNPMRLKPGIWPFGRHKPHYVVCSLGDPGPALSFPLIALRHVFNASKWKDTLTRSP